MDSTAVAALLMTISLSAAAVLVSATWALVTWRLGWTAHEGEPSREDRCDGGSNCAN